MSSVHIMSWVEQPACDVCPGGSDEGQIGSHLVDALPLKHLFLTGYGPTDEEFTRNPVIPASEQRYCIFVVVPYKVEQ